MHNTINRVSGIVQEGGLFANEEIWSNTEEYDLYILRYTRLIMDKELSFNVVKSKYPNVK